MLPKAFFKESLQRNLFNQKLRFEKNEYINKMKFNIKVHNFREKS